MGFNVGTLGRVVIFGSVVPVLGIGGVIACLAVYGVYKAIKG